jgi:hypothetical protein
MLSIYTKGFRCALFPAFEHRLNRLDLPYHTDYVVVFPGIRLCIDMRSKHDGR